MPDQAFHALERALAERAEELTYMKLHPFFVNLRGDPRFEVLLRKVNLDS
jgi:hypothetical protein